MKCKWIKKLTAGIIFLAAVGSLSGCQKAATSENLFRDIEVNMTSVESAEENQIVKLQMGDGDSAISQESNLDIEMTRDPAAVHGKVSRRRIWPERKRRRRWNLIRWKKTGRL